MAELRLVAGAWGIQLGQAVPQIEDGFKTVCTGARQANDGFGLMRDAQTAKPQSFRTGDGWFAFNLATNLARM